MRESTRKNQGPITLGGRSRVPHLIAICIVALGVALGAAPALASTGSVYYDNSFNVGAGTGPFFGGAATGGYNVGIGTSVMPNLTTGFHNVASGYHALNANTTGRWNVATGSLSLLHNTSGSDNSASGYQALYSDTYGSGNIASGYQALYSNTGGMDNIASGVSALHANTTAWNNIAIGRQSLESNTTGAGNLGGGSYALDDNTTGDENVALGYAAMGNNTSGDGTIALGSRTGGNLTTGSNNIDIANAGVAGESGKIRIGTDAKQNAAYLAAVWGKTIGGPTKAVVVNNNGRLGTAPAPAAPLKAKSQTITQLAVQMKRQQREINRLREQVRKGD